MFRPPRRVRSERRRPFRLAPVPREATGRGRRRDLHLFPAVRDLCRRAGPYGMNQINPRNRLLAPSWAHPFGTDNLGRDMLSRCLYGAQVSVIIAFTAATLATVISIVIGILTGYLGGKVDLVAERSVDVSIAFPTSSSSSLWFPCSAPACRRSSAIRPAARHCRLAHHPLRRGLGAREHVRARRPVDRRLDRAHPVAPHPAQHHAADHRAVHDPRRHRDPRGVEPVVSRPRRAAPDPTWGGMLSGSGTTFMFQGPWLALAPGLCLTVVVYATNVFGDALRDLLDPRMRGSR